jgi:hypothetical protein
MSIFKKNIQYIRKSLNGETNLQYLRCPAYDRLISIYLQTGEIDEAIRVCELGISRGDRTGFTGGFKQKIESIKKKANTIVQKKFAPQVDRSSTTKQQVLDISLPVSDWEIMVSFMKTRSDLFDQAVMLAKLAPKYIETQSNGKAIYQASYSHETKDYLKYVKLYELIKNWKSCNVFINNKLVDRKVIGSINYCYGDRCRSGNPDFCDGASEMTANPFGCHRLQISAANHPWLSFIIPQTDGSLKINKGGMKERIDSFARIYSLCPVFSYPRILQRLKDLPDRLYPDEYRELLSNSGIYMGLSLKIWTK